MRKGSPADRSGSVPKYSNPRQKSPGESPNCGCPDPKKNPYKGSGKSASTVFAHAHRHSSKNGSPHNRNGNSR